MIDYLNELRESCLEAYTGIIQGLKGESTAANPAPELALIQPHVPYMVQFITVVAQDSEHSDASVAASAGLVGYAKITKKKFCRKYSFSSHAFQAMMDPFQVCNINWEVIANFINCIDLVCIGFSYNIFHNER